MIKSFSVLFIGLIIFGCNETIPQKKEIIISPMDAYKGIIANLNSEFPGRGMDVFDEEIKDRPMAYGLILSAEVNRYKHQKNDSVLNRIETCGNWLLENLDINQNAVPGYGIADRWDAFNDSSINPAHLEYTITTALALKGLLDWQEIATDSLKKNEIELALSELFQFFLVDSIDSPLGIPAYSFAKSDLKYDVYNPAVYLAGQMQRYSKITSNDSTKVKLKAKAKKIIDITVDNSINDINGNKYWTYGVQKTQSNDLVHACYVVEGIRDYIQYGGDVNIGWSSVFNHLDLFYVKNRWYEHIEERFHNDTYNSRMWGLGMLMYSLSLEKSYEKIDNTLWPQINEYYLGEGAFKFKLNDERQMIRQDAHLLLGLSFYLFNSGNQN